MMRKAIVSTWLVAAFVSGCAPSLPAWKPNLVSAGNHRMTFYSTSLKKEMNVDVYLPPGYDSRTQYPVLYLFHGKDGTADTWMSSLWGRGASQIGIDKLATTLITTGKIRPLIIVSPEMDNGYGVNTSAATSEVGGYSRGMYEDYIVKDLLPYVDHHYCTIADRNHRFIGGLSMGAFAALHDSFLHQDEFSKVGVMSAALWVGGLPSVLSWIYPSPTAQADRDPITIAQQRPIHDLKVMVLEGDSDPFLYADRTLYRVLQKRSVSVVYHQYPGGHDYTFWRGHAEELLFFFAGTTSGGRQ